MPPAATDVAPAASRLAGPEPPRPVAPKLAPPPTPEPLAPPPPAALPPAAGPIAFGLKAGPAPHVAINLGSAKALTAGRAPTDAKPTYALSHLLAVGLDYDQLPRVRFNGKALIEQTSDGKVTCWVSKRKFASDDQLRKHIAKSKLYKEAYEKACVDGKITLV